MNEQEAKATCAALRKQVDDMATWGHGDNVILLQTQIKMVVVVLSNIVAMMEKEVAEKFS